MSGTLNLRYRVEPQKINLLDEIHFPKSCYCAFASASMSGFCVAAHHIESTDRAFAQSAPWIWSVQEQR